jgi:hypothetical protein
MDRLVWSVMRQQYTLDYKISGSSFIMKVNGIRETSVGVCVYIHHHHHYHPAETPPEKLLTQGIQQRVHTPLYPRLWLISSTNIIQL